MQGGIPVGSTFNIQNFIPHKSQKTKAVPETNRAKEFQRGTAGVPESVKEGATGLHEGSDIGLGSRCREFESPHSDQKPESAIAGSGFFFVYGIQIIPTTSDSCRQRSYPVGYYQILGYGVPGY